MEYTLFQDVARKIPRPSPPAGRPGRAQSGRTPEFGYGPLDQHALGRVGHFFLNRIKCTNRFVP